MTRCTECGHALDARSPAWRCPTCAGVLELDPAEPFGQDSIDASEPGFWRYAAALPSLEPSERLRLGEVMTPLVQAEIDGRDVLLKLDYLLPSGSYKDRGAAVLMSFLRKAGVSRVFDDSSGNAGAAAAAYAAAARIDCTILVPAKNSPGKLAQISAYGAHLVAVEGTRADVAEAAIERAANSFYASHVWHPVFNAGVATLGFELWEQLGYRAPSSIFVPAGQGSLVLGLARAFEALLAGHAVGQLPSIFAVRSHASLVGHETVAEGIACRQPLRERLVVEALGLSAGQALAVTEAEIVDALRALVRSGFYVEPTGSVGLAGWRQAELEDATGPVVVVLTGSGLKAGKMIADLIESGPADAPA